MYDPPLLSVKFKLQHPTLVWSPPSPLIIFLQSLKDLITVHGLHLFSTLRLSITQSTWQYESQFTHSHTNIHKVAAAYQEHTYTPMEEPSGAIWWTVSYSKTLWHALKELIFWWGNNLLYLLSYSCPTRTTTGVMQVFTRRKAITSQDMLITNEHTTRMFVSL